MAPEQIEREVRVNAPIERVWAVITEGEHAGGWLGDSGATIDLRPGGAITITWRQNGTAHGVVERVEPPHRFAFRWARPIGAEPAEGNSTRVELVLAADGARTRVRVVESGFRELRISEQEQAEYAEENRERWRNELDELAGYLMWMDE